MSFLSFLLECYSLCLYQLHEKPLKNKQSLLYMIQKAFLTVEIDPLVGVILSMWGTFFDH